MPLMSLSGLTARPGLYCLDTALLTARAMSRVSFPAFSRATLRIMNTDDKPSFNSLVDHFLIAMPQLADSYFANTVIYVWRHSQEGALGLVINLPIRMQLTDILEQLGMEDKRPAPANQIVLSGGPVETEKGFVLHDS